MNITFPCADELIVTFLVDTIEDTVDAVILSSTTSSAEIQEIIDEVKHKFPEEWTIDDLLDALPEDCIYFPKDMDRQVWY